MMKMMMILTPTRSSTPFYSSSYCIITLWDLFLPPFLGCCWRPFLLLLWLLTIYTQREIINSLFTRRQVWWRVVLWASATWVTWVIAAAAVELTEAAVHRRPTTTANWSMNWTAWRVATTATQEEWTALTEKRRKREGTGLILYSRE